MNYPFEFQGYFGNNIFYGRNEEEFLFLSDEGAPFVYQFDHCSMQTLLDISDPLLYPGCIKNEDPLFLDYPENNFSLDTLSPLIDKGSDAVINESFFDLRRDIVESGRPDDLPDLGAYEFIKPDDK